VNTSSRSRTLFGHFDRQFHFIGTRPYWYQEMFDAGLFTVFSWSHSLQTTFGLSFFLQCLFVIPAKSADYRQHSAEYSLQHLSAMLQMFNIKFRSC